MRTRLKPCPFCGNTIRETRGFMGLRFFRCSFCGAVISFDNDRCNNNPDSTYEYWNRRANEVEENQSTMGQLK